MWVIHTGILKARRRCDRRSSIKFAQNATQKKLKFKDQQERVSIFRIITCIIFYHDFTVKDCSNFTF